MSERILKVQQQIRRLLSELLARGGRGFGIGIISIDDILVSRDLSNAKVWVSFIAERHPKSAFNKLLQHSREIQTHLYKNFHAKKVPTITWLLDEQPDASYRIDQILDDLKPTSDSSRGVSETSTDSTEDSHRLPS